MSRANLDGDVRLAASRLADDYWEFHRGTAQLWNVDRGDVDQIEQWEDFSAEAVTSRIETLHRFGERAGELVDSTDGPDRTLVMSVGYSASSSAAILPYLRDSALVAGPMDAVGWLTVLVPAYGLTTAAHGRGYVVKVRSMPTFLDRWINGLRDGASVARTATARGIAGAIERIDRWLERPITDDPLTAQAPPTELSEREAVAWRDEVIAAVPSIRAALVRLRTVLHDEIAPVAPGDDRVGLVHRPDGAADYDALLRAWTSTAMGAVEIHELGLRLLRELEDEYARLGAECFGLGDPVAVRTRLRDDPALRYASGDEVIADAVAAIGRAEAAAPGWFATIPTAPCTVAAVHGGGFAFYTAPSPDGARGGTCYVNVADASMWTRSNLEPTIFHEAVPGHHLQLATAQQLDLHPVLSELEVASFGEGWGLYAERLADEMGLYTGSMQRLGMLTLDSLRAARLTVDTGLHAMGWTRSAAIEFLLAWTALATPAVEQEVDRYIADPGQATSYMVGRLEIDRLRAQARRRLGDRFDAAGFHAVVLGSGMTPLPALERTVRSWLAPPPLTRGRSDR